MDQFLGIDIGGTADASIGYSIPLYGKDTDTVLEPYAKLKIGSFVWVVITLGIFRFNVYLDVNVVEFIPAYFKITFDNIYFNKLC